MDVGGERAVILDGGATICQSYHMCRCYYPIGTIAPLGGHCPGFGKRCVCVCVCVRNRCPKQWYDRGSVVWFARRRA